MADIFISYARVDVARAHPIADALQTQGWEVWWDLASLRTGQSFNKAIRKALGQAKCVLVLWSETSAESRWVEAEASWAWAQGKLASVLLDQGMGPPFPYHNEHAQDLSGWSGDPADPVFRKLIADLSELAGLPASAAPAAVPHTSAPTASALESAAIRNSSPAPQSPLHDSDNGSATQPPAPSWASGGGSDRFGRWAEISLPRKSGAVAGLVARPAERVEARGQARVARSDGHGWPEDCASKE